MRTNMHMMQADRIPSNRKYAHAHTDHPVPRRSPRRPCPPRPGTCKRTALSMQSLRLSQISGLQAPVWRHPLPGPLQGFTSGCRASGFVAIRPHKANSLKVFRLSRRFGLLHLRDSTGTRLGCEIISCWGVLAISLFLLWVRLRSNSVTGRASRAITTTSLWEGRGYLVT